MVNSLNILSLYSGTGQHDEAVCLALEVLGYVPRVVGYCEREAFAAAMLLAGMANSRIPQAPVWCDEIERLDARPLRGWVDVVVASPPCQPYSCAGKRAGVDDHRSYGDGDGPLPHTIRIIAECQPAVVWFENVPQWVSGGHFARFGEGLSELGYTIEDPIFLAAEDVGAPHGRERVFIMAHACGRVGQSWAERERVLSADRALGNTNNKARISGTQPLTSAGGELSEDTGHMLGHSRQQPSQRHSGGLSAKERGVSGSGEQDGHLPVGPKSPSQSMGDSLSNGRGSDQPGWGSDRGVVVGRGGPELALGPCGGQRIDGQSSGADGLPGRRGEELAHSQLPQPSRQQQQQQWSGVAESNERGQGSSELANNNSQGFQGRHTGGCAGERTAWPGGVVLPLFPPPRGIDLAKVAKAIAKAKSPDEATRIASAACGLASRIWRDWRAIASLAPSLMPSVESGVSVVADGLATTPELLRAGGNGVVPLQVAVAFVYQWLSVFGTAFNHLAGDLDQAA